MKTAYELAMERLEAASGPTRTLSEEEKAALAEIDKKYDAQVAAARINFDTQMATCGSHEARRQLRENLARELATLEDRRERYKDAVWGER